ncbi:MAG: hypothetical protein AAF797_16625 [Planctomycetota bacterium]
MVATAESKPFEVGTLGWRVEDLEDPAIARQWFDGRYEIIEGGIGQHGSSACAGR